MTPDIHLLFPPVAWKLTLREQATKMMMEEEIRTQAMEQQAATLRVQVLCKKFETTASKKSPLAAREDSTAGHKQEVHWGKDPGASATASPDATMTETEVGVLSVQHHASPYKRHSLLRCPEERTFDGAKGFHCGIDCDRQDLL